MGRGWILVAASAAAAATCYKPSGYAPCSVSCSFGATDTCPDNLECHADNMCHAPGIAGCGPALDGSSQGGPYCYGGSQDPVQLCFTDPPGGTVLVSGNLDVDTSTSNIFCTVVSPSRGASTVCGVHAETIMQSTGTLTAKGPYPLVLIATNRIEIDATVKLASDLASGFTGAGARTCGTDPGVSLSGAGGGAGGSYGTLGGAGGFGTNGQGGVASVTTTGLITGGCEGGRGGQSGTSQGGSGGAGGGAVLLMAGSAIDVGPTGLINASGAGGGSAAIGAGGGGGGAGGYIGLDAPLITIAGTLIAEGGGGGAGGGATGGAGPGNNPTNCNGAAGGIASGTGGPGGDGARGSGNGSNGQPSTGTSGGGGGGGGGAGKIVLISAGSVTTTGMACP